MVQQGGFPTELIAVDLLRLEGQEIVNVLIGLARRIDGLAARIEAAAFEPLRVAEINIVIGGRLEIHRRTRGKLLVSAGAVEVRCVRRQDRPDAKSVRSAKPGLATAKARLRQDEGRA